MSQYASILFLLLSLNIAPSQAQTNKTTSFDWLNFSLTPDQIRSQCNDVKAVAEDRLKALVAVSQENRTFANTVKAFDGIEADTEDSISGPIFLKYVSTDKAVRDAAHECEVQTEQFGIDIYTREDLYNAFKDYADKKDLMEPVDQKLLDKILLDFRRNGLELAPEKREQVKKLKTELAEITAVFGKNLNEYKDSLEVTTEELAGLPEDYVKRLDKTAEGRHIITLNYPDYFPFMANAENPLARQKLEQKFNSRGAAENIKLLEKAINLRHQIALTLGYPTHAHYVLEDRMAQNPDAVLMFLNKLKGRLQPKLAKELESLRSLKKKKEATDEPIKEWDWRFYDNLVKKSKYKIDDEAIKAYFPMEHVTQQMLEIYQQLLGLRFQEVSGPRWHDEVKLYAVRDVPSDALIAYFYMDLYPREGKYKHAAAFSLVLGRELPDRRYQNPVSAIVANFNKPTKEAPSLLKHSEVETYFHEFGHIMHQILTQSKYGRFSGTKVARDFVEAPSQMLENWIWQQDILGRLTAHYQNPDKKLPKKTLQKMVALKNLHSGITYTRQLFFALLDLTYHTNEKIDSVALWSDLSQKIRGIPVSPNTIPPAGFGHLMGGYDAGYYGYLWSEVYAADMFTRFEKEGILNPQPGRLYRQLILEPGRSKDEGEQLRTFLGREPNEEAFLKSLGLDIDS